MLVSERLAKNVEQIADGYVKEVGHVSGTNDWAYYESNWFTLPPMPDDCSMLWFLFIPFRDYSQDRQK